jgi:two-component system, chemotaxis family, chemotaxis protein CheY
MVKTVMVVDDLKDVRDVVKKILASAGYKVLMAVNADDCLKKLEKEKPYLILMDVMMPGTPVGEIIPKIKKTKIALLTVVGQDEIKREKLLKQKNIVAYIPKPFDIDVLLEKVKKLLA